MNITIQIPMLIKLKIFGPNHILVKVIKNSEFLMHPFMKNSFLSTNYIMYIAPYLNLY